MPAYDFRCVECSHVCEITRPGRDDSPVPCPVCGGATKQVWHPVGVHFKGSGFYNTDSRPAASAEGDASPSEGGSPPAPAPASECPASTGGSCEGCPSAE